MSARPQGQSAMQADCPVLEAADLPGLPDGAYGHDRLFHYQAGGQGDLPAAGDKGRGETGRFDLLVYLLKLLCTGVDQIYPLPLYYNCLQKYGREG